MCKEKNCCSGISGSAAWDDDDTAKGMARLFAELGEAYTTLIASGTFRHLSPDTPNNIMKCVLEKLQCSLNLDGDSATHKKNHSHDAVLCVLKLEWQKADSCNLI